MANQNGRILWEGPSAYDGQPIVVIATGFESPSDNPKTGDMIQTWILRQDVKPNEGFKSAQDGISVCGDCPHAGYNNGTCYVSWYQGPLSVWNCYKRGGYAPIGQDWSLFSGRAVRLGSAGDPAMVPFEVWKQALEYATKHTGYTHQWRYDWAQDFKGTVQASCDGFRDYVEATAMGWNTFLVTPPGQTKIEGTVHCAASEERGNKTTCQACHLCDGKSANVMIWGHGRSHKKIAMLN